MFSACQVILQSHIAHLKEVARFWMIHRNSLHPPIFTVLTHERTSRDHDESKPCKEVSQQHKQAAMLSLGVEWFAKRIRDACSCTTNEHPAHTSTRQHKTSPLKPRHLFANSSTANFFSRFLARQNFILFILTRSNVPKPAETQNPLK
jgi:hypothetical protein